MLRTAGLNNKLIRFPVGKPPLRHKGDDKPGYVADGHLSRLPVARQLKRPT